MIFNALRVKPGRMVQAACLAGLAMAGVAVAAPPPAKPQPTSIAPPDAPKSVKAAKASGDLSITEVGMGGLVIEFGTTKLDDVRKSAGGAIAARADNSGRWLCYTAETGRRIWVSSDTMANGAVNAVTLAAQPGMVSETACPGLPPRLQPGAEMGGVSLGQRRADVEAQLGHGGGDWARYESCSNAAGVKPVAARRCTTLTLHYINNRVMQITASQTSAG